MRFRGLCIPTGIVGLPLHSRCETVILTTGRESKRRDQDIARPAHLLERQQFITEDIVAGRELLVNASTKQLAQDRHVQMPVDASPSAAFKAVQAQFLFGRNPRRAQKLSKLQGRQC